MSSLLEWQETATASISFNVTTALYNRDILRLAASIPHLGRLPSPQVSVEKRSPVCGSHVVVDVVLDEQGNVTDFAQEVRACALGQASASILGANVMGCNADQLIKARDRLADFLAGEGDDPGDWQGLELFREARRYSARHPSIMLPLEAVAEAVRKAAR